MKKVCYILPEYNPYTDTHFAYLYDFLKEVAEKLDIFLIVEKHTSKEIEGNFKRVYFQRFARGPLRFLELNTVVKLARFSGYKYFYTHYSYIGALVTGLVARFTLGKSYYWNCASAWNLKQRLRSKFLFKLALKSTQFLVTGTKGLKDEYARYYGKPKRKIEVMPNWIDENRFKKFDFDKDKLRKKLRISEDKKILLFVHHISSRKGSDFLVPIMKNLSENYVLLVIGSGPDLGDLNQQIKAENLQEKIILLGKVPNQEIVPYFLLADLFLMPSREEGFPRVILECMATGLPYIAFDTGGTKEISPKAAQDFILPMGEVQKMTEKVEFLLRNKEVYNRFKNEEREKAKEFSQEKIVDIFVNLFS